MLYDVDYKSFLSESHNRFIIWLQEIEASKQGQALPSELYHSIKLELELNYTFATRNLVARHNFFWQITPKMRSELIHYLF